MAIAIAGRRWNPVAAFMGFMGRCSSVVIIKSIFITGCCYFASLRGDSCCHRHHISGTPHFGRATIGFTVAGATFTTTNRGTTALTCTKPGDWRCLLSGGGEHEVNTPICWLLGVIGLECGDLHNYGTMNDKGICKLHKRHHILQTTCTCVHVVHTNVMITCVVHQKVQN